MMGSVAAVLCPRTNMWNLVIIFVTATLTSFCYKTTNAFSIRPASLIQGASCRTTSDAHNNVSVAPALYMGKGLNKARNKQAELRRKMELAKQQNRKADDEDDANGDDKSSSGRLSDEEMKERNDRLRFEELLKRGSSSVLNDFSSDGYLTKEQEEEEINAARSGVDRIFEGDAAPKECFEELVSIKTENAIGERGAERLFPRGGDYLVVLSDPRLKSFELRTTIKSLRSELPQDILSRLIFINADSPMENRRWLKKNGLQDNKLNIYSDEKMEWMQAYTALGEKRWSMTMFVIADDRVQKLAREVDYYGANRTIRNAVKSL